ncbi:hypothetical protein HPB49_014823 [Dermacentor silvarum]|uniref:Uncharacterized protein n=1 Tax=Dermacentor silvarum TaxID=543639 RepID=A0ACB8D6D5_DERSI|nr:hypothetical protein HPB49_014823 [Dermacentor silvarum]
MRHNEWLNENAALAATDDLRPRLLAAAQERHERLRSLTISEALVLVTFLASEASVCSHCVVFAQLVVILLLFTFSCSWSAVMECDIVFKKNVADDFDKECEQLCDVVLKRADDSEVAPFSDVATENPILAIFEFVAAWFNESLSVVLSELPRGRKSGRPVDSNVLASREAAQWTHKKWLVWATE